MRFSDYFFSKRNIQKVKVYSTSEKQELLHNNKSRKETENK